MERLKIDPRIADLNELVAVGTRFHGHLGPYLVAGIRMGLLALELLGSDGYFGIVAESETGSATPLSCLTDGIQLGSGCTTGKGNLRVLDEKTACARFFLDDGRAATIALRPEIDAAIRDGDLGVQSERMKRLRVEELFTWTLQP